MSRRRRCGLGRRGWTVVLLAGSSRGLQAPPQAARPGGLLSRTTAIDEETIETVVPAIDVDALVSSSSSREEDHLEDMIEGAGEYRSGFVAVIGSPNVGKSSLVNALVGERLCIATSKAQTTRHGILGVVTTPKYQLALTDTPGLMEPAYALQKGMMSAAKRACRDAEVVLLVTDIFEATPPSHWIEQIRTDAPLIVAVNKVDLITLEKLSEAKAVGTVADAVERATVPNAVAVLPVSALEGTGVDDLAEALAKAVPVSAPVFPEEDVLTDRPMRFFASEIVREHILRLYAKEVPYSCEVAVTKFKDQDPDCYEIDATILVDRPSQKAIVIGAQGAKIKQLGTQARLAMEDFFQVPKIRLHLWVKVDPNWRSDQAKLRDFGYPV